MHGGTSKTGLNHHSTTHGRRSKYLPRCLQAYYREANDPAARCIADEIALLDTRLSALTARLGTGESSDRWRQLAAAVEQARRDLNAGRQLDLAALLTGLSDIIASAADETAAWREIQSVAIAKAKLLDCETRQQTAAASRVTPAELGQLAMLIRDTLQHVCTREQLIAIQERVFRHPLLAYRREHDDEPAGHSHVLPSPATDQPGQSG